MEPRGSLLSISEQIPIKSTDEFKDGEAQGSCDNIMSMFINLRILISARRLVLYSILSQKSYTNSSSSWPTHNVCYFHTS